MSIDVQARGFALTEPLEQYVLGRIRLALGSHFDSIDRLRVRLSDINGPRGGADKQCSVHIALPQHPDVVIEDVQPDMYHAIDSAVRRARHAVRRRLSRLRTKGKRRAKYTASPPTDDADTGLGASTP